MLHKITRERFNGWADFKANLFDALPGKRSAQLLGRHIFRGQGDENWGLISSFDRRRPDGCTKNRQLEANKWIEWFMDELLWRTPQKYVRGSFELLSLAQHVGLPTRLLDWSWSPYVAAFFAYAEGVVNSSCAEADPAIWVIDVESFSSAPTEDVELIRPIDGDNVRMRNQNGLFTLLKTNDLTLDNYVERVGGLTLSALTCLVLPSADRRLALQDLSLMGIDYRSVYPDLSGLASYVVMKAYMQE